MIFEEKNSIYKLFEVHSLNQTYLALAGDLCVKNGAKMDGTLELGPCRTSLALTSTEKFLHSFSSSFLFKK